MFASVKKNTNILQVIEDFIESPLKQVGESWTTDDDTCPFCGHHGCFRITEALDMWKCFSEDTHGDSIRFVAKLQDKKDWEAALEIAKRYSIKLPNDYSPIQEIFNCAAAYYHQCLLDDKGKYPELTNRTPLEYQLEGRKHKQETLEKFTIGWSDGGLVRYLDSLGFQESLIVESGLQNKKGTGDFLPSRVFVYPHLVRGRVSHFTFKDPLKKVQYQIPNKHKLNEHAYYNSDSIKNSDTVYVVEGENDVLSINDDDNRVGAIATIGMISASQIEWLITNLADKKLVTIFDSDLAGDTYREKVEKVKGKFKSLVQLKLPDVKDIDDFITSGRTLHDALKTSIKEEIILKDAIEETGVESESTADNTDGNIIEKEGCYYKIKYKDGQPIHQKISNFTITLRNIYIQGQNRNREIVIKRADGKSSKPFEITSEVKVSLKSFKTVIANAVDATFYGQEMDLALLWDFVYANNKEREVFVPQVVGRDKEMKGWIFNNVYISDTGAVIKPDSEGIIWRNGSGIKPTSINSSNTDKQDKTDIPTLECDLTDQESDEFTRTYFDYLAKNLGDIGLTLTMLGWLKACTKSNEIVQELGFFPFLFFWGKNGKGKSSISRWMLRTYGMDPSGHGTVGQLGSGVGFQRKIGYYGSLPVVMDEIRGDRDTVEHASMFRSWYNRSGRTLGLKDDFRVREQSILSCVMFVGEDQFNDDASRQRCVSIRIPVTGRETSESYAWIEDKKTTLSCIGFNWVLESTRFSQAWVSKELNDLDAYLRQRGCNQRTSKNWAIVALFGREIAKKYFPDFDYEQYLINTAKADTVSQATDDKVMQFFDIVEGMQVVENSKITSNHIHAEGDRLFIWYAEIFRLVQAENRNQAIKEEFSKNAIRHAIIDEDYCVTKKTDGDRMALGINQTIRRGLWLDLKTAPEVVKNIGRYYLGKL